MAVHVHFTPRVASRPGVSVRRPVRSTLLGAAAVLSVLVVALLCARLSGVTASALVLTAGAGSFGTGLTLARRPSTSTTHAVLGELSERVQVQGRMPELPSGWRVDSAVQAASGAELSGDFVVGNRTDENRFELALVDVSGNGLEAGSRSLLMGGAVSGLLGPVAPEDFLPAANDYLVRQGWAEGFATAVHACVDFASGSYTVGSAGHPSAVHFHAASRTWSTVHGASGTCLGVLEGQAARDYPRATGVLRPGDALLLYTDGLVESRDRDMDEGLQAVLRQAGPRPTAHGAAARMCALSRRCGDDDRSVVLLCRD